MTEHGKNLMFLPLTYIPFLSYVPSHLILAGGSVTWDALERGGGSGACGRGADVALRTREASGFRPGSLRGSAASAAGRGQAAARNRRRATSPEERTEAKRSPRRNVE